MTNTLLKRFYNWLLSFKKKSVHTYIVRSEKTGFEFECHLCKRCLKSATVYFMYANGKYIGTLCSPCGWYKTKFEINSNRIVVSGHKGDNEYWYKIMQSIELNDEE